MTTPVNNQTTPQKTSFVTRAACAFGRGVVKIAEITGKVSLTAMSVIGGGALGISIVNLAEKAYQKRQNLITYIPPTIVGRLPKSIQQAEPATQKAPLAEEAEPLLEVPAEVQTPTAIENLAAMEPLEETKIEADTTVHPRETIAAPKATRAKTLIKAMRVAVGILVLGTTAAIAYRQYQSTRTPEKYSLIYESPVEDSSTETHQEHLNKPTKVTTQIESANPSKEIGEQTQAINQSKIEVVQREPIVIPEKPSIIVPQKAEIVAPAKPELVVPPGPQPIELPKKNPPITVPGLSASQALELVRSGKPLPKGVTLQGFGISEAALGRRAARGLIKRK